MPEFQVSTSFTTEEAEAEEAARNFAKDASDIYADGELLVKVVRTEDDGQQGDTTYWRTGPKGLRQVDAEETVASS